MCIFGRVLVFLLWKKENMKELLLWLHNINFWLTFDELTLSDLQTTDYFTTSKWSKIFWELAQGLAWNIEKYICSCMRAVWDVKNSICLDKVYKMTHQSQDRYQYWSSTSLPCMLILIFWRDVTFHLKNLNELQRNLIHKDTHVDKN